MSSINFLRNATQGVYVETDFGKSKSRRCFDRSLRGRIVYRDEAAALSRLVDEGLYNGGKVILDLSGVTSIDSAGIGELVFLHTRAQSQNADLKVASPSELVSELLDLTNVNSILEIHPNLNEAIAAFEFSEVCADC